MDKKERLTIKQLFEDVIGIKMDYKINCAITELKKEGYSENAIVYGILKSRQKVLSFKDDSRFIAIFKNEVRKNAMKWNDPRWELPLWMRNKK